MPSLLIFTSAIYLSFAPVQFMDGEVEGWVPDTFDIAQCKACMPEWVELHNTGKAQRHVLISLASRVGSQKVQRKVVLDPGERRVVSFPIPTGDGFPSELAVRVEETRVEGTHPVRLYSGDQWPYLVLGTEQELKEFTAAVATPPAIFFDRRHMPDLVASYLGLRGVLLLDASARELGQSQRAALENYALIGGAVFFGLQAAEGQPSLDQWRAGSSDEKVESLGLGQVLVCHGGSTCNKVLTDRKEQSLVEIGVHRASYPDVRLGSQFTANTATRMLPEVGHTPVGVLMFIVLVFAFLMGPGNLIYARKHGRHTLLMTIPLLAFTTCSGITVYAVSADGLFTTHAQADSITFLDSERHRAATLAATGYYAALGPSELRYSSNFTDVFSDSSHDLSVDWTDGLKLHGDMIPSRTYCERASAGVAPTRARIVVSGQSVENALDGRIVEGLVRMNGKTWRIPALAPGEHGDLKELEPDATQEPARFFDSDFQARFGAEVIKHVQADLEEGEFLVSMSTSHFVPSPGLDLTWHPGTEIVRGRISR